MARERNRPAPNVGAWIRAFGREGELPTSNIVTEGNQQGQDPQEMLTETGLPGRRV